MAKIIRKVAKIFGSTAGLNEIAEFGSLAAGSPTRFSGTTADPAVIQSLSNWLGGWFQAVIGANSPAEEDMNAFCFVMAYQIAYLMQEGVAEWETNTIYYKGSLAQDGNGNIFVSTTDANTGNALTSTANWSPFGGAIKTITANYAVLPSDGLLILDASAGAFTLTFPAASTLVGVKLKKIDSSANPVTLTPNGGEFMDGETSQLLQGAMAALEIRSDRVSNLYTF